ncbi:hypothetical protein FXO37_22630 [Capsicum annuum]|nr:hypothetical protein FXO37_22630 [Capsicum annuum]
MIGSGILKKYPEDVVIQMLLRLHVKFLLRFKCVSQIFYTLIQSSIFISLYLHQSKTSSNDNILLKRSFKEDIEKYKAIFSFLSIDAEKYLKAIYVDLDVPYIIRHYSIDNDHLIGPRHGLIALMDPSNTILFNPSTRKCRLLPSSPFDVPNGYYRSIECGGFALDSIFNDFKDFRISRVYMEDRYGYPEEGEKKVEVYEIGIDIWRELDHVDNNLPRLFWLTSSILYKGTYHWITTSEELDQMILCFDVGTEIFRSMKTPYTNRFSNGKVP